MYEIFYCQPNRKYSGSFQFWPVFLLSTSLINRKLESKINESGLRKSDMQLQVQDMYLHVNQGLAEYNCFLQDSCIFEK
jgi:hypothetical protein